MRLNCGSAAALAIVMVVLLAQANATRLRTVSAEPAEDVEVALERKESLEARYIVPAAVYTRSPDWVHAFGRGEGEPVNDRIEICGCGFSQYSSATCIFNGIWASVDSHIIDDGHVVCEVPIFPSSYFAVDGLPQNFQLDVVFDNDYDTLIHLEDIRVGPQVNPEDALSAYAGYTTGGNTISIFGTGFLDAGLGNSVTVYFDDAETTGTVDSDTAISVAVPPGRFNQNARIRIYFNGGEFIYFLEVLETYHYGPIADEITTPCVHPRGNQDVTIVGRFFDDPAFTTDYAPTILVSYYDGVVEWQVNVESNTHDDTTITFTAPDTLDLYNYNDDIDAWGIDVSVMIYFQQVMSSGLAGEGAYTIYVSGNEPLTYHYGAFVYYEEGARVNGDPASTPGIPTSYLHQGGGDEVCMKICGANFYNYDQDDQYPDDAVINFILANAGGTTFVDSYCAAKPVLNTDNLVDYACCTTEDLACSSGITRTASKIKVEIITPDGDYASNGLLEYEDDTFANQPTFTVGPVFAETNDRFIIIPAASTDEQLVYTVYANEYQGQLDSDNDDWDDICVTFYDDDYIGDDADYNSGDPICLGDTDQDGTIERSGDTITITLLDSWKFDRTNYLDIDYDDNTANCKIENPNVHWGPLCNSEFYWDDGSYDIYEDVLDGFGLSTEFVSIDGGTQVTITGIGLDQEDTSTLVALCQRSPGFPGSSSRFTANLPSDDSCTVYNLATNLVAGSTTYSFTVPDNDVHQFIWGDQYDVWIYYDDVATTGDYIAKNAPLDYFDTDFDYNGRILCGNLRFGCAVSDIGTCTGPFGSTKNWLYKNANGDFNDDATVVDPLSALSSLPIAGHQLTSSFGFPALAISGGSVSTNAVPTDDNTITLSTQWHKDAFVNTPVHLVCDACNFTDADTAVSVSYGPRITYLVIDEQSIGDSDELDDMWGAQPDPCKPKSSFRIYGWGFELYRGHCGIFDYDSTYECMDLSCTGWVGEVASYIDVYVDGVLVEDSSLRSADPSEGDYYIEGSLPHRPYGTEAVVKLVFGRRCHEESYDMGAYPNRFLVADQHIHYIPLLESYSPSTYFAQAFGATTIFVTGRGFNNFDVSGCFLDNYQMEGEVHSDTEIQCYFISGLSSAEPAKREIIDDHPFAEPPTNWRYDNWGGEFNTYVPFHLEFYSGDKAQLLPIEDKHPIVSSESEHDWKLTADDEFWWGSQCSIGCNSYRFDDDWSTFSVSGFEVPQCYQQEKYDEYIGSTEDEFDPHEGGTVSDFPGSTYCVYRYVNLDLQWTDESGNTHLFPILTEADSLESGVFDDLEVPSASELADYADVSLSQIPCPLVVTALATFTDALVTNEDQRVIQCLGEFTYGPSVYNVDVADDASTTGIGYLPVGHPQNDNPDEVPEFYGWIDDEVTFEIDDFNDEYMNDAECVWTFQTSTNVITSPIQGGTDDGPSDSDGEGLSCVAPSLDSNDDFSMFDEYAILSIRWPSGNNLIACEKTIAYFYYGPGLFYTEHCESTIYAIDQVENATVFVVGPKCCELNGNIFPIFGIDYDEKINYDDLTSESGGVNIFSGRYLVPTVDSLPSLVPMRTLGPLGFHFENLDGDSDTVNTNADCDSAVCRFNTVLGSDLNALCYGPILDMEAVNTRYTYSAPNEEESDSEHPHVFDVTFQGLYLDTAETDIDSDDNYYAYFCDKKNGGNTCNLGLDVDYDGASTLEVSLENAMYLDITGTDGGDVFRVSCGDPLNEIEFAFEYKDEVYIQKENWQFPTTVATNSPTLFPQTGDNVHLILDHNPKIVSVDVTSYNRLNIFEGDPDSVGSVLHVSEYGNLVIEVTFSNVYDFYQQGDVDSDGTIDSTYNFGFDGIIGLLGDADQTNFVAHTFNEDGFDCQNTDTGAYSERGFSGACLGSVISDITPTGSNGYGTARFVLPPGPFNSQAYLHFLLNPSVNGYTEAETEYHWQPYVTAVSKDWHDGNGHDTIVFQGEGFCGIAQEYGTFEDDDSSSGEYSGDFDVTLSSALSDSAMYLYSSCSVLQDTLVACTTSRAKEPGSYETTLTFKTNGCEGFNCNEEGSVIPTPNLNVYGINGEASPTDLSFLGGQKLFVPFHYGQVFDEAYCLVDGVQSLEATWTGSGFLCVTNAHPNGNNEVSRPALVEMRLLRNSPWGSCGDEKPYETTTLAAAVDLAFPCFETVGVANNATLQPVATFYRNQLQEMDSTTFYFSGSHLPSEQSNTQYHCVYEYFYGALFITDVNGDVQPLGTTEATSAGVSSSYGSNGETANVVFRCQWDPSAHDIGHDYTHVKVKIGWGSTGSVVTSSDRYCAAALASSDLNAPLAGELQPKKVSFIGGTSIFVPFSGGDYFDEVYCNIDGYEHSAPAVWVGNGFNCISPDFIDDNLDGRPVAVELLMYTDPYCSENCEPTSYHVISASQCVDLDYPCVQQAQVSPRQNEDDDSNATFSAYAVFDKNHLWHVFDGTVRVRGDYVPSDVDMDRMYCVYEFFSTGQLVKNIADGRLTDRTRAVKVDAIEPHYDSNNVADAVYVCSFNYADFGIKDYPYAKVRIGWLSNDGQEVLVNRDRDCFALLSPASALLPALALIVASLAALLF